VGDQPNFSFVYLFRIAEILEVEIKVHFCNLNALEDQEPPTQQNVPTTSNFVK